MTAYDLLTKNIQDIKMLIDNQANLLGSLNQAGNMPTVRPCVIDSAYQKKLKETLLMAIQTLEASRKAFKSKQLEDLRKRLTEVLAEIN